MFIYLFIYCYDHIKLMKNIGQGHHQARIPGTYLSINDK